MKARRVKNVIIISKYNNHPMLLMEWVVRSKDIISVVFDDVKTDELQVKLLDCQEEELDNAVNYINANS